MNEPVPNIIYWLMSVSGVELISLPTTPESNFTSAEKYRQNCRPWIPLGAEAWRSSCRDPWRDISELPAHWGIKRLDGTSIIHDDEEDDEDGFRWPWQTKR